MSPEEVAGTFLYYGYVPGLPRVDPDRLPWAGFRSDATLADVVSDKDLVAEGLSALAASFGDGIGETNVVPLSGGLDSRCVLSQLRRRLDASQIVTASLGIEGSFDFEIGRTVAAWAGVRHVPIDLRTVRLDAPSLEAALAANGVPTWAFDTYYNRLLRDRVGADAVHWSGVLGGTVTSSEHLPASAPASWQETCAVFAQRTRSMVSAVLAPPGDDPVAALPKKRLHPNSDLDDYEQLYLSIRQVGLIIPVNLPRGYDNRAPFCHQTWLQFALSLPRRCREGQDLYRKLLLRSDPELFRLPTTNDVGLSLAPTAMERVRWRAGQLVEAGRARLRRRANRRLTRMRNYLDFSSGLRERADLHDLGRSCLSDLQARQVVTWVNLERLWREHDNRVADNSQALTRLISLELNLRAGTLTQPRSVW